MKAKRGPYLTCSLSCPGLKKRRPLCAFLTSHNRKYRLWSQFAIINEGWRAHPHPFAGTLEMCTKLCVFTHRGEKTVHPVLTAASKLMTEERVGERDGTVTRTAAHWRNCTVCVIQSNMNESPVEATRVPENTQTPPQATLISVTAVIPANRPQRTNEKYWSFSKLTLQAGCSEAYRSFVNCCNSTAMIFHDHFRLHLVQRCWLCSGLLLTWFYVFCWF